MPKTASKPVQVTVRIDRGRASPAKAAQWHKFWRKLIGETRTQAGKPKGG